MTLDEAMKHFHALSIGGIEWIKELKKV
jgi:hypothetical protein